MSLWNRIFGSAGNGRNPADERWWTIGATIGRQTTAVTADTVIQIPEVYDCLTVLSQSIAQLPFFVYEAGKDDGRQRLGDHPVTRLLGEQANITQEATAYELRAQMTWDAALFRNAYAEIRRAPRGPLVFELVRHDPLGVDVRINPRSGEYLYVVRDGANTRRVLPEEMLHLRVTPLMANNLCGRSMLETGYRVFSRALVMEDYTYRIFENDATPGGIIEYAAKVKTLEDAEFLREKWQRLFGGRNRNKVGVIDDGGKFVPTPLDNKAAQFIETYKEVALSICRLWRMQPHKIGLLDKAAFSNIEQQALEFVTDTLMPWIVMWEQAIKRDLLSQPNLYAHHNVAGLLRGDLKSRYESYAQARNWGWLSVDDIRRLENMNPLPNGLGTTYLEPLNMVPAGTDRRQLQQRQTQQPNSALAVALENYLGPRLLAAPGE
jgi:HK97 family phage portal protein